MMSIEREREIMYERFAKDAEEALGKYSVLTKTANGIRAEAGTGSAYEIYATPAVGHTSDYVVTVRFPRQSVFVLTPGMHVTAEYISEKTGMKHGGDLYAVMECLARLIDVRYGEV